MIRTWPHAQLEKRPYQRNRAHCKKKKKICLVLCQVSQQSPKPTYSQLLLKPNIEGKSMMIIYFMQTHTGILVLSQNCFAGVKIKHPTTAFTPFHEGRVPLFISRSDFNCPMHDHHSHIYARLPSPPPLHTFPFWYVRELTQIYMIIIVRAFTVSSTIVNSFPLPIALQQLFG